MTALLEVDELAVRFGDEVDALRGVSLRLERGESLAIVGESGAGKSTLALCLAGLIQPPEASGSVQIGGQELLGASGQELDRLRWETVAVALQGAPFNPVISVGDQVAEPLRERRGMSARDARRRAGELAGEVLLDEGVLERHPHQISGGERRRAALATALALDPDLLVLDEPVGGLDPATRRDLVERIAALRESRGFGLIVISHDLPEAAQLAERSMVLYAGETMEEGPTSHVIGEPAHPYSFALIGAYPLMSTTKDLRPLRGRSPDPRAVPPGCPFHPRCPQAEEVCWERRPALEPSRGRAVLCHFGGLKTLLHVEEVGKTFRNGRRSLEALRSVSLTLRAGESLGVVGSSGSGKSTLARIVSGHLAPDEGQVWLEGTPLPRSARGAARSIRRRVQLVMQDPWDALSPRMTVEELVGEPLRLLPAGQRPPARAVEEALDGVGLPCTGSFLHARSHELSGGQLQRIALARALVARPTVVVADEPTSMLDASEQARLLLTLRERQIEMGLGLLLISHDLALVRKVTDRIVVLDGGQVAEEGPSNIVSTSPRSVTGRRLLDAAPALSLNGASVAREPVAEERSS